MHGGSPAWAFRSILGLATQRTNDMTRTRMDDLASTLTGESLSVVSLTREELLEKALSVALKFLSPDLPGDSRAVPDWFVACAAVLAEANCRMDETIACLDEALALPDLEPSDHLPSHTGSTRLTLHPPIHHPELEALLEKARNAPPMTEAEWAEQRASMARGLMED